MASVASPIGMRTFGAFWSLMSSATASVADMPAAAAGAAASRPRISRRFIGRAPLSFVLAPARRSRGTSRLGLAPPGPLPSVAAGGGEYHGDARHPRPGRASSERDPRVAGGDDLPDRRVGQAEPAASRAGPGGDDRVEDPVERGGFVAQPE